MTPRAYTGTLPTMRRYLWLFLFAFCAVYAIALDALGSPLALDEALTQLQPALSEAEVESYTEAFRAVGQEHEIDPLLLAALAFRESSLWPSVVQGRRRGSRGEVGMMQVMPHSAVMRFAPRYCPQTRPRCSLRTAAAFLVHLRDGGCPGTRWRWIAAYGRSRCPSEADARRDRATRRARALYRRVGGERWRD